MAFDVNQEEFQRLGLHFADSLTTTDEDEFARLLKDFEQDFALRRETLPQQDDDRAFHLVAQATMMVDYELPLAIDTDIEKVIDRARDALDEALVLDPYCFDALRMRQAIDLPSFENYLSFLNEQAPLVLEICTKKKEEALSSEPSDRALLAADLAMRPYLRWLATQASKALICGRNTEALAYCQKAFEVAPHDPADVRFTAALAYAKLEDQTGLDELSSYIQKHVISRPSNSEDAWMQLARIALAFKSCQIDLADEQLRLLCEDYPKAAVALASQRELPDGLFSRVCARPFSEDEIILAVSEGIVLLQEGFDRSCHGALGAWVAEEAEPLVPPQDENELMLRKALDIRPTDPMGGFS